MKKLNTVLLLLGAAFLAWLVWKIGLRELWRELKLLRWGLVPLILSEGVANLFHTLGWRHCLSGPHRRLSWVPLYRIWVAGFAINYLTPSATVGGDVAKVALLASNHKGAEAVSSLIIDKACMALAHLLMAMGGSVFLLSQLTLPPALRTGMLLAGMMMVGGITGFLLLQQQGKLGGLLRWLVARKVGGRAFQNAALQLTRVDETLKWFYRERRRDLLWSVGWHVLGHAVGLFQTWLLVSLLAQPLPLATITAAWVLTLWFDLMTFAVPMNLGTLEGGRILSLKAIGQDALTGMTFGVALRLMQLFWSAFGLINYALLVSSGTAASGLVASEEGAGPGKIELKENQP